MRDIDKFRGCLFGGAVGDALGYPVEFIEYKQIQQIYGKNGITSFELNNNIAEISDDTQMTLFTANGLLVRTTRGTLRGIAGTPEDYCWSCYKSWYKIQNANINDRKINYPWLIRVPELYNSRAPGNTIINALNDNIQGTIDKPINNSKGCGGVMRVAPIGLYFETDNWNNLIILGAKNAALTHGHDLGYIPAGALVYIINAIIFSKENITLEDIIINCISQIQEIFKEKTHIQEFISIMKLAIKLSKSNIDDYEAISSIGLGWVAEEALAIAIYCSLKYKHNFEEAIIASVNHDGDSDSTGSITGNIIGTLLGYNNIPEKFKTNIELKDIIMEIAEDLYNDFKPNDVYRLNEEEEKWFKKYASC